ncbi:long-chain fatty acid transport protein 1-like isoform X1 [Oratosquilla oratoria]|uniref:long-chain fatty acid transport protein 1-like isoform X1 n=1 Tax=Oratosquilla oratoria TaxID=337810 RepID=UPI003F774BB9
MLPFWRPLLVAGVTTLLGRSNPNLSGLQLFASALGIYLTSGGYYTLWLMYKTFPRDIKAGIRYLKVQALLWDAGRKNMSIPKLFMENVHKNPNKIAFHFEDTAWTFTQVDEYSNRIANYLVSQGFQHGDTIALYMQNRPEFVCTWLGCSKIGVVAALINFNLRFIPLVHSIKVANSKGVICGVDMQEEILEVMEELGEMKIYISGSGKEVLVKGAIALDTALSAAQPLPPPQLDSVSFTDKLVYIFTSGTTGLPKAAIIKHCRYLFFCSGVHYMTGMTNDEIIYNPLPLYHTAGGMAGIGQVLIFNNTAVIRKKFSASRYWVEAKNYGCTVAQYVGELCRYLLTQPPRPEDKQHKVRIMFGNGVRAEIWEEFTARFNNPCINEVYGATEGIANVINIDGKTGACGFLSVLVPGALPCLLIKIDETTGEHMRDESGLCIKCGPGEPGEFVGKIKKNDPVRDFDGYADKKATQKKIVRDVFTKGDFAFASGDILVQDEYGYLYFKDRMGDTFRWRGENVSTTEVESVVFKEAGSRDCVVYGVEVPGVEGKAGMAAIVDPNREVDLDMFLKGIQRALPSYARPLFLRMLTEIDVTGTFKLKKLDLQKQGFEVNHIEDDLYFLDNKAGKYVSLTEDLYTRICQGQAGL